MKTFVVLFSLMCFENVIRILGFVQSWTYTIEKETEDGQEDNNYPSQEQLKEWSLKGPYAGCQTLVLMFMMIFNIISWANLKEVTAGRHTLHYFVATAILILYIPRKDWWPVMLEVKFLYTNMSVLIF